MCKCEFYTMDQTSQESRKALSDLTRHIWSNVYDLDRIRILTQRVIQGNITPTEGLARTRQYQTRMQLRDICIHNLLHQTDSSSCTTKQLYDHVQFIQQLQKQVDQQHTAI